MTKHDGGPAFPVGSTYGMSLRDWFATHALNSMLVHPQRYRPRPDASPNWHAAISKEAYMIADAMMSERTKT